MATDGKKKTSYKKLVMYDFDDTLAQTEEVTLVRDKKSDRIVDHLSGQKEFDEYKLNKKHYFDFSEFKQVSRHAQPIGQTLKLLSDFLRTRETKTIILTARQSDSAPAIKKYLKSLGIDTKSLQVYGCDGAKNKAVYLKTLIKKFGITDSVLVFEDSLSNIANMVRLEYEMPDINFEYVQVVDAAKTDEDLEEIKKHKYPKGETGTEPYQRLLRKIHPAMKRRLLGLGSNDYLVKGAKRVKDYSRSKSAPPGG